MWHLVVLSKGTNVSQEPDAYISYPNDGRYKSSDLWVLISMRALVNVDIAT
jgi:hypothetical protein